MLYMVIERFHEGQARAIYRRFRERGRVIPDGLAYVDSWVERDFAGCYQLMECDDPALLHEWAAFWRDLVDFEFIAVMPSARAAAIMAADDD